MIILEIVTWQFEGVTYFLLTRIAEQFTGNEPRYRTGNSTIDPLRSDPGAPYFYEWRFTPNYPGFPLRPLNKWKLEHIRDCNNALESGELYLVDVRKASPRPPVNGVASSAVGSAGVPNGHQNRKRLVNLTQAAFSKYIGTCIISYQATMIG